MPSGRELAFARQRPLTTCFSQNIREGRVFMVDLECKAKMIVSRQMSNGSKLHVTIPETTLFKPITNASPVVAADSACTAYEQYIRLPELNTLWGVRDFPEWSNEAVLRPALNALEITFRLISTALSDPRCYINRNQWERRLQSIAATQIGIISQVVEAEAADPATRGTAPIIDLSSSSGMIPAREGSHAEVWKATGEVVMVVSRSSEESLLPRLAAWRKSEDVARRIHASVECQMGRCPYTLGLGEPNLSGKPNLNYDAVCRPAELAALKKSPSEAQVSNNLENQAVYSTHQILECWIQAGKEIQRRFVVEKIERKQYRDASDGCYILEQIWKLLADVEDLLLLADPDDFLKLKAQLLASLADASPFCFRSRALVLLTKSCKELRQKVPEILGVEVDPKGGPRVQEAAMRLFREGGKESDEEIQKVHLLQGLQCVEKAIKGFYYGYKQLLVFVMGSLEASGNRPVSVVGRESGAGGDNLAQMFLEPTYFPSLDAAKTFIGDSWTKEFGGAAVDRRRGRRNHRRV